ncbi:MAG: biotin synthase [Rubrivivax sp.]
MAERLPLIRHPPARWIDWHAHRGGGTALLRAAYPEASGQRIESLPPPASSRPWWRRWSRDPDAGAPRAPDEIPAGCTDLLWSNMSLHLEPDPAQEFSLWRRALAVDGFLMFSTIGPGTLVHLNALYAEAGWGAPFAPAVDMHDLGDLLVEAGFAEPVMDQETLTLTWPDAAAALAELRSLGGNAALDRFAGLRTPRWRDRLHAALEARRGADGRIGLAFEVVYGHAFCPPPRMPVRHETRIDAEALRSAAQRGIRPLKK